jgi:hypothetical protein
MVSGYREKDARGSGPDWLGLRKRTRNIIRVVAQNSAGERQEETEAMLQRFSDAGDLFVREAKAFDQSLDLRDIYQALRNLWIINSIQVALGLPVCMRPPGFAYSLLYPYTDNYLDDDRVTPQAKRQFSLTLRDRLEGKGDNVSGRSGERISSLVGMIEKEYPRELFRDVYESLLAIHDAQEKSLGQHSGAMNLSASELLSISIGKGGASVLADGYLAGGKLTDSGFRFSFEYGVFLQLIDDLQDVKEDLNAGHRTICTDAATDGELEAVVNRLVRFIRAVLNPDGLDHVRIPSALSQLVERSCYGLILETIAHHPGLFRTEYVRSVERYSPVSFACMRDLRSEAERREKKVPDILRKRRQAIPA